MKLKLMVVALLLAAGSLLSAYDLTEYPWSVQEVPYYINPTSADLNDPEAVRAAILYAAAQWNAVQANIRLVYAGESSTSGLQKNGLNEITFGGRDPDGYAGRTVAHWNAAGERYEADIEFYETDYQFFVGSGCVKGTTGSKGVYLENIAVHEFGHVLGIKHSQYDSATMWPTLTLCSLNWLTLATDDKNGLKALYPRN
jgi:hypothetical protein